MIRSALRWTAATLPLGRWALAAAVICFSATVSLFRFVDSAWLLSVHFSAWEILDQILRSPVNGGFIYLPLCLFLCCGIPSDPGSGPAAALLCGSRRRYMGLLLTRTAVTVLAFFALLLGLTGALSLRLFPASGLWSADYLSWHVMQGGHAADLAHSPALVLALLCVCRLAAYMLAALIALWCGLVWKSEALALALGLLAGLPASLLQPGLFPGRFLLGACCILAALGGLCLLLVRALLRWGAKADLDKGVAP